MKKFFALTAALVFLGAGSALAFISGSAHDFAGGGTTTFDTDICAPCHTPHNSYDTASGGPLWSHNPGSSALSVYTSATFNGGTITVTGISLACLSCHDGTIALDSYIGGAGTAGQMTAGISANLTEDLTNDHPVSFNQDTSAAADPDIYDAATAVSNSGNQLVFYGVLSDQLECATCHDVHNAFNVPKLLRYDNTGSVMCLDCHNK